MPSEPGFLSVISAVIATAALVASVISARSAARSAAASEASAKAAIRNLQRTALRDLVIAVHRSSAETARIRDLVHELHSHHGALANHSGSFGGSRHKLADDTLAKKLEESERLAEPAIRLGADIHALRSASIEDLTEKLSDVDASVTKLVPMREGLEREQDRVLAMLQTFQDKVIQGR